MEDFLKSVKCPFLAVDAVIAYGEDRVIVIERGFPPLGYAFPGGFVDYGESLEDAVRREVKEETNLDFTILGTLYPISDPNRDKRGHIVSIPFYGVGTGEPMAKDDAKNLVLARKSTLLKDYNLVLGHKNIFLAYALKFNIL